MDFLPRVKHEIKIETVRPEMEYRIVYSLYLAFDANPYSYDREFKKVYEKHQTYCGSYFQACNKAALMKTDFMYANIDMVFPSLEQEEYLAKHKAEEEQVKSMIKQVKDAKAEKRALKKGLVKSK